MNKLKVYADEELGHDGLIYKAGLSVLTDTLEGRGRSAEATPTTWLSDATGSGFTITNGGWKKSATEATTSEYLSIVPTTAYRESLGSRGFFQCQMNLADLTAKTLVTKYLLQAGKVGAYSTGLTIRFDYKGDLTGYNQVTKDLNDNEALVNSVSLVSSTSMVDSSLYSPPVIILHDGIETDSEGYFTFGMSWNGGYVDQYINGVLVSQSRRLIGHGNVCSPLDLFKFQTQVAVSMRNLLIYDRPVKAMDGRRLRIQTVGHSFMARDHIVGTDLNGTPSDSVGFAAPEQISSKLFANIDQDFEYRVIGDAGQDMEWMNDIINGDASMTYAIGVGTYSDTVTRFRPHFCIICGYSNGVGALSTITNAVDTITASCITKGVIPVFVNEQNRDQATTPADNTANNATYISAIEAQQAIQDIGKVDIWTLSGGSTVDVTWIESGDASDFHPNLKALGVMGETIATEINRLIASPPSYSNLAKEA
jgi:hypothetical protein